MPIAPVGLVYVVVVGLFAPYVALRSAGRLARAGVLPSRAAVARSVFVSYAILGLLSWAAARACGVPWIAVRPMTPRDALAALAVLALLLAWAPIAWRTRPEPMRRRVLAMLPETPGQGVVWIAIAAGAGFFEEIAWRGVLFTLLAWLLKSRWAAAILAAASFGIVHAVQGRRSMLVTGLIGLLQQGLVAFTGSLLPAMLVHFVYDAVVGFLFRAGARRDAAAAQAAAG